MQEENKRKTRRRSNRRKKKKALWKKIMLAIGALFLVIGLGLGGLLTFWIATAPEIDASKLTDPLPSEIYDRDGELIATLGAEKRKKITYDDLPPLLIDAVTATEDARFFDHHGIDIRRIGGAIKANFTQGFGAEGASTITQQVVENAFLTPDKQIKLKVQEQWLALKLEREYSKEQIMEMYLNKIFYGSNAYGVAQAAETYFGKTDLHELTLAESAVLAGLPQRPSGYNPFKNPELMEKRMGTVLDLMVRHKKITPEEAEEAKKTKMEDILVEKQPASKIPYPAYRQQIEREVRSKLDGVDINTAGLKIYTNLDTNAQEHVELLLSDSENNPINYPDKEMQTGVTVLDTKTGGISAIGGRRNQEGDQYNFAIQGGMQPGSTAKPYMAYGPAIETKKLSTYHQINDDAPYTKGGGNEIRNWDRKYRGWVSMRDALANSWNVPAVKTLEETGLKEAQNFAEGLGINFKEDKVDIRDAIGGTGSEVTPLQLAGAYHAFGNEGIYTEPHAVVKVEYPDGKTVDLKPDSKAAMADYTAYMVTDMLKSVVQSGTGTEANISNLPVAGKTGTTTLTDKSGSPDAWFAGYTTNYTISVWAGGYVDEEGHRDVIPEGYTRIPQQIFKNTMTEISKNIDTADFKKPDSVVELSIAPGSNPPKVVSGGGVKELFVKGHEPSGKDTSKDEFTFPAVEGLQAVYNEDNDEIEVSWNHDSEEDAEFEISFAIDGGSTTEAGTTDNKDYTIDNIKKGSTYKFEVVARSKNDNSDRSEPRSVQVKTGEEEQEVGSIKGLQAKFAETQESIDVSWEYDGAPAQFEVSVSPNQQKQTTSSKGIEITGVERGTSYTITVTPITNDGERGNSETTTVSIPPRPEDEQDDDNDNQDNNNENNENNNDNNQNNQNQNNNNGNNNNEQNNDDEQDDDEENDDD